MIQMIILIPDSQTDLDRSDYRVRGGGVHERVLVMYKMQQVSIHKMFSV